jgi:Tfp pilus assembly protein PilF
MSKQHHKYYLAGSVALITFTIYLSSLGNQFVNWDDPEYVIENPYIRSFDLNLFKWAFFDFYAANWHPLTWISHALDYAAWGLNPMGHHLTSIILHTVNTFLVVLLVVRLLASWQAGKLTSSHDAHFVLIAAATTGLLFGLHPLHVESVAWVSERKDLLCALFFLLSVMMYMSYNTHKTYRTYLLTFTFFTLALMSKPMAVSLPAVLLILDWYPFARTTTFGTFKTAFIEKLPFIALSIGSSILTLLAQNTAGAVRSVEIIPLLSRVLVAAQSLVVYLWKMLAPLNLIPLYTYPRNISFFSYAYILPVILTAAITLACIIAVKKQRSWITVWFYYVATLLPVLGIVQVGGQSMADRYTYLPGLGPFLAAGLVAAWVWEKIKILKKQVTVFKCAFVAVAFFIFVPATYLTIKQIGIWNNSIALWSYVIEKEPAKVNLAYYMRGLVYQGQGDLGKAIADYNMVNALEPFHFEVYHSLGSIHEKIGQNDKAIENYSMAIAINPRAEETFVSRGILYGKAGLFDKAIEDFNKAIEIDPAYPPAYLNRGTAYFRLGQDGRALADFTRAIELDQNYAGIYVNRGSLYLKTGDKEHAASDYRKACELGNQEGCDALQTMRLSAKDQVKQ